MFHDIQKYRLTSKNYFLYPEEDQMKKQISIFSCSALVLAIVASCSSNVPVVNSLEKVDSVKVSQINKIQTNENGSVKVNLRLTTNQPKFGIKALGDAWLSSNLGSVSSVHLKLHSAPGTNAMNRYDSIPLAFPDPDGAGALTGSEKIFNTSSNIFSSGVFDISGPIRFNNLKPNTSYYLSARAYSTNVHNNANHGQINLSASNTAGSGKLVGDAATRWFSSGRNRLNTGDIVSFNDGTARNVRITNVISDNQADFVDDALGTPFTIVSAANTNYTVKSNITGKGNIGGAAGTGMASNGNADGGGTAPALVDASSFEERIVVSASGAVSFFDPDGVGPSVGDVTLQAASPIGAGAASNSFDVAVQIMKDIGGYADGSVRVYQGGAGDGETITP
jgi:hypothetical protein